VARRKRKNAPRRVGRPAKRIDLAVVRERLGRGESLRSVSRSLMVSHATILAHFRKAGLIAGLDTTQETVDGN
jgi:hypothetical protein